MSTRGWLTSDGPRQRSPIRVLSSASRPARRDTASRLRRLRKRLEREPLPRRHPRHQRARRLRPAGGGDGGLQQPFARPATRRRSCERRDLVAISSRSRRDLVAARSRSDLGAFSAGRSAQAQSSRGGASVPEAAGLPAAAARLRHGAERVGHRTCVEHMTMMHGRLPSPLCLPSECSELRREGAWGQRTARRRRAGGRRGGENRTPTTPRPPSQLIGTRGPGSSAGVKRNNTRS